MTREYDPDWMENLPRYTPWNHLNHLLNMFKNTSLTEKGLGQLAALVRDELNKIDEERERKKRLV